MMKRICQLLTIWVLLLCVVEVVNPQPKKGVNGLEKAKVETIAETTDTVETEEAMPETTDTVEVEEATPETTDTVEAEEATPEIGSLEINWSGEHFFEIKSDIPSEVPLYNSKEEAKKEPIEIWFNKPENILQLEKSVAKFYFISSEYKVLVVMSAEGERGLTSQSQDIKDWGHFCSFTLDLEESLLEREKTETMWVQEIVLVPEDWEKGKSKYFAFRVHHAKK